MKIRELIELLQECDPDLLVIVPSDGDRGECPALGVTLGVYIDEYDEGVGAVYDPATTDPRGIQCVLIYPTQ